MIGGWLTSVLNLLGMGGGGTVATPDIGLHIGASHFQVDGTYTIDAQVGLSLIDIDADWHAHGTADLTVSDTTIANETNCSVMFTAFPLLPMTVSAGTVVDFTMRITPTAYGAFSFDLVITSDDPDQPTLTVGFAGFAYDSQIDIGWTAPNRLLEWTADNRRLEWTAT